MPELPASDDVQSDDPLKVDLAIVARDLKLPPEKVAKTIELLDAGNTIPFITRFRKDLTGGLNEEQILSVKQRVVQLRALAERKAFVLKSIESQGKLNDDLKVQIGKASTSRRLEDLYLPFKAKKQSRTAVARQQGLEPLADDIFSGVSPDVDLATRATDFVRVDKGLKTVDEVIKGVGDLLAERFNENDELRSALRKIMWSDGQIAVDLIAEKQSNDSEKQSNDSEKQSNDGGGSSAKSAVSDQTVSDQTVVEKSDSDKAEPSISGSTSSGSTIDEVGSAVGEEVNQTSRPLPPAGSEASAVGEVKPLVPQASAEPEPSHSVTVETQSTDEAQATKGTANQVSAAELPTTESAATETEPATTEPATTEPATTEPATTESAATELATGEAVKTAETPSATTGQAKPTEQTPGAPVVATPVEEPAKPAKRKKRKKKKKRSPDTTDEFSNFKQPIKQVPHHRILAINRGERAGRLKIKVVVDGDVLTKTAVEMCVPAEHPFTEFLQKCSADSLNRMIVPSLEREIRRELTEAAEKHAVEVFANNLRNLLLQPPIRDRVVLAIDPGFKRGCSVAVLDKFGHLIDSGHVFVVGNQTRRDESKQKLVAFIAKHDVDVIAIGTGAACRQTEQLVSDTIAELPAESRVQYVMVNEAGASIYSTSEIGREELPDISPSVRSAVSIGRRLQDPLSELVKISPANIGVGMYQHDVKAKHLSESLDEVVEFCVNQVGVNVNSASPSLLKYVSGLNALTARRVVEHRQTTGGFKTRDQLREVSGFGDATFVQAAGFLRIHGGDEPLDCTSIHPESYSIAKDVLNRIETSVEEFFPNEPVKSSGSPANDAVAMATPAPAAPAGPTESTADSPSSEAVGSEADQVSVEAVKVAAEVTPVDQPQAEPAVAASQPKEEQAGSVEPSQRAPGDVSKTQAEHGRRKELLKKISDLDIEALAAEHNAGKLMVKDILMALKRPKWDPRDKVSKPIFRRGIIKADDLKPEMQLDAQVVNVVDFGVFVDIGLGESSLVHVSQLSNHFIRDPHRFYAVGDVLKVWVSEVDSERRRVKLTAIRPGSKRPPRRGSRSGSGNRDAATKTAAPANESGRKPGKYEGRSRGPRSGQPSGKRSYEGSKPRKGAAPRRDFNRRSAAKPAPPITDGMLKGEEPMRSFSDLLQFVTKKPDKKKSGDQDSQGKSKK